MKKDTRVGHNGHSKKGEERREERLTGRSDPLVVPCEQVRDILQPLIDQQDAWKKEYQQSNVRGYAGSSWGSAHLDGDYSVRGRRQKSGPLGGIRVVAFWIGIDPARLLKIVTCQQKWVGFGLVDRWLTALDLQHKRSELTLLPNPGWSKEKWWAWNNSNGGCEATEVGYEDL